MTPSEPPPTETAGTEITGTEAAETETTGPLQTSPQSPLAYVREAIDALLSTEKGLLFREFSQGLHALPSPSPSLTPRRWSKVRHTAIQKLFGDRWCYSGQGGFAQRRVVRPTPTDSAKTSRPPLSPAPLLATQVHQTSLDLNPAPPLQSIASKAVEAILSAGPPQVCCLLSKNALERLESFQNTAQKRGKSHSLGEILSEIITRFSPSDEPSWSVSEPPQAEAGIKDVETKTKDESLDGPSVLQSNPHAPLSGLLNFLPSSESPEAIHAPSNDMIEAPEDSLISSAAMTSFEDPLPSQALSPVSSSPTALSTALTPLPVQPSTPSAPQEHTSAQSKTPQSSTPSATNTSPQRRMQHLLRNPLAPLPPMTALVQDLLACSKRYRKMCVAALIEQRGVDRAFIEEACGVKVPQLIPPQYPGPSEPLAD